MSKPKRFAAVSLAPLVYFSMALSLFLVAYLADGDTPSERFQVIASFGWSLLLAMWLVADARRHHHTPCFDFGLFCYLFLPLMVPWYCFWSRGRRGAMTLMAIIGLWLAPHLVTAMVWGMLYG